MTNDQDDKARDETAMEACVAARAFGANSGREAANITMGRELTDVEWSEFGSVWTRSWENMLAKEILETDASEVSIAETDGADEGLEEELNSVIQLYRFADEDTRMEYLIRLGSIIRVTKKELDVADVDYFTFKADMSPDQVEPITDKVLMFYKALDDQAAEDGDGEDDRAVTRIAFSTLINSILAEGRPKDVLAPQIEFLDKMIALAIDLVDKHS
jgi:hypothetical protein